MPALGTLVGGKGENRELIAYVPPVPCRMLDIERSEMDHGVGTLRSWAWARDEATASRHNMIIFVYCILSYKSPLRIEELRRNDFL